MPFSDFKVSFALCLGPLLLLLWAWHANANEGGSATITSQVLGARNQGIAFDRN